MAITSVRPLTGTGVDRSVKVPSPSWPPSLAPQASTTSPNTVPLVMRPILLPRSSVNQRLLSGPAVIPNGTPGVVSGNSAMAPVGVMRPILLLTSSVNQRLPSGPAAVGRAPGRGGGKGNV